MSLGSVRAFLQANAPDIELIETGDSSSTVELAAKVHGVEPAQIAKTICLRVGDKTLLIVASGIARLNNRKDSSRNNLYTLCCGRLVAGTQAVVPFAMKFISLDR